MAALVDRILAGREHGTHRVQARRILPRECLRADRAVPVNLTETSPTRLIFRDCVHATAMHRQSRSLAEDAIGQANRVRRIYESTGLAALSYRNLSVVNHLGSQIAPPRSR